MADEAVEQRVEQDLQRVGLGEPGAQVKKMTVRLKDVYPVYCRDYEAALSQVTSYLSDIQNLVSTGRGGYFCYNNLDHSIDMGRLAAGYYLNEHTEGSGTGRFYRLRPRFEQYRIVD